MKSMETTPIVNILQGDELQQFDPKDFILTSFVIGSPKVQKHKDRLGRQAYCFTTYRRYWVWETEKWRVYVHNDGGVAFEVPVDSTGKQALDSWADYKKAMGVTPARIAKMKARMERARALR